MADLGPIRPSAPIAAPHGVGKQHKRREGREREEPEPAAPDADEQAPNEDPAPPAKGRIIDDYA